MQCGLLGRKLSHSYSPQIHGQLGSYPYQLFEVEPEQLEAFLKDTPFTGLNVTIPYKKAVIPFCDQLSEQAKKLMSVNTLVRKADGTLIGHNTDYFGFSSMLDRSGICVKGKKVLVLGSGGASATVCAVLQERNAQVVVISRSGENHYGNLQLHYDAAMIVNTTPVGMYPKTDAAPLELDGFEKLEGVLDLIYNPANTLLMQQAQAKGIYTQNGLWMLVAQAKESAQWFTEAEIDDAVIDKIYRKLSVQMRNIVLVGMPGCGKSTIGSALAAKLGRTFVDADQKIVETAGASIPEIFRNCGESGFRAIETQVLQDLGKGSGLVIATGGGCVTREENYPCLHQNGTIFWLQRDIASLPTDGRPLSQTQDLQEMYKVRMPLYSRFADHIIQNDATCQKAIGQILEKLEK